VRRATRQKESTELQNPLSGLVYCGLCGRMMTRQGTGTKNRSEILRCPTRSCRNVSAKLELVENALIEGLSQWLNNCRVKVSRNPAMDITEAERNSAEKLRSELERLDTRRDRIYTFLEQGVYSTEEFRERTNALNKRREQLSERLKQTEQNIGKAEGNRRAYAEIIPRVERVMEIYADSTPAEKNRLMKTIVSKATYIKTERNTRSASEKCSFTLDVLPLLPEDTTLRTD
ncbi:MAG: recombinase zinc beta ribbon domain-containing protein, partial [Oscillospiraceae bacterium]